MDQKYVQIPPDKVANVVDFRMFVEQLVNKARAFNVNHSAFRAGQRVLEALDAAAASNAVTGLVVWRDDDHKLLRAVIEGDDPPLPDLVQTNHTTKETTPLILPGRAYLKFFDAILDARSEPPAVLAAAE